MRWWNLAESQHMCYSFVWIQRYQWLVLQSRLQRLDANGLNDVGSHYLRLF
jgi:hypothetical protein